MEASAELQSHNGSTMPLETLHGNNGNSTDQPVLNQDVLDLQNWVQYNLKYIASIGGFLLIVLGTVGNGISMAVMRRERMKSAVAVIYLMALAITDTAFLWISGGHWWILATFDLGLPDLHMATCKLYFFLGNFLHMLSAWIIVFLSVQRMLVVLLPYKAKQIATRNKTWLSLLILTLTLVAYNTYPLIAVGLFSATFSGETINVCVYGIIAKVHFHQDDWQPSVLVTSKILPYSMIFIANMVLIVKFIQSKVKRTLVTSEEQNRSRQAKRITTTLISVSLIFLILHTPRVIVIHLLTSSTSQDKKYGIILNILGQCAYFLVNLNHAINFLLYYFTWPPFRMELCILMREWRSCSRTTRFVGNRLGQHSLMSPSTDTSTIPLNVLSS